jgi:speckle-type POZ protein
MLHFIYTDTLADIDKEDDALVITQHLLVASDRYGIDRLKLICEEKPCDYYINTSTVATTLALAGQHSCKGLKEACFDFLKTPSNLKAAVASEGFDHLVSSCPSVVKELRAKVAPCS